MPDQIEDTNVATENTSEETPVENTDVVIDDNVQPIAQEETPVENAPEELPAEETLAVEPIPEEEAPISEPVEEDAELEFGEEIITRANYQILIIKANNYDKLEELDREGKVISKVGIDTIDATNDYPDEFVIIVKN